MSHVQFTGRVLFLAADPDHIDAQLAGADLPSNWFEAPGALRDEVSTDEITPVPKMTYFDERLGRFTYTGFKVGARFPFAPEAARAGGFGITVAGARYGKGSSREHSPFAEQLAGIRLVVAKSFERIYRQNADNIGLFTSTDFVLIERIRAGQAIELDELLAGRDALTAAIVRAGGLLRYGQQRLGPQRAPAASPTSGSPDAANPTATAGATGAIRATGPTGPMTLAEKIISRHRVLTPETQTQQAPGVGLFVQPDWRYIVDLYTGMAQHLLLQTYGAPLPIQGADSIVAFEDHLPHAHRSPAYRSGLMADFSGLTRAHRAFVTEHHIRNHGFLDPGMGAQTTPAASGPAPHTEGADGISHPLMLERYALPGQLLVATDSHTPHSGALGCVAFGVGTTDMANAFVTGAVRLAMPASLLVWLDGRLAPGVSSKDVALHLLALPQIRAGAGLAKMFEFAGPAVAHMSTDERATLTNMVAELGGFSGIVAPDAETVRFLQERRGITFEIADWMHSDEEAVHALTISLDCSTLSPMVAAPGDPGNGVALASLGALEQRPRIDIAYGGTCTGGKRADFDEYHAVLHWANQRGLKVAPGVELVLQFGTADVAAYCEQQNYLPTFERVGAQLLQASCGACANLGPGGSSLSSQVTVSAQNRNFPGRSGPGQLWIASPATVAASAVAGRLVSFVELMGQEQSLGS